MTHGAGRPAPGLKVAVVGTGTQGAQIAYRCVVCGHTVSIFDVRPESSRLARDKIAGWIRRALTAGELDAGQAAAARRRVHLAETLETCVARAEIVIEAVPEDLELKRVVWAQVDAAAPPGALLATNSSSIRGSLIAAGIQHKDQTLNVNFGFPAEDDTVEVMWNPLTSEETRRRALAFLDSLSMHWLETKKEIQGFSFNRVWRAIKKECLHLVAGGYCDPESLDRHFVLVLGTRCGPFALMDLIGLDVVYDIEMRYYEETGDLSDRPPEFLREMVASGYLGMKAGKGFYDYPNHPSAQPRGIRKR